MVLLLDGEYVQDRTPYDGFNKRITLTDSETSTNKEFFYDIDRNKIVTNQNLEAFSPQDIRILFYKMPNKVSVKCRVSSNSGSAAYSTPIIDYYILKLKGQRV